MSKATRYDLNTIPFPHKISCPVHCTVWVFLCDWVGILFSFSSLFLRDLALNSLNAIKSAYQESNLSFSTYSKGSKCKITSAGTIIELIPLSIRKTYITQYKKDLYWVTPFFYMLIQYNPECGWGVEIPLRVKTWQKNFWNTLIRTAPKKIQLRSAVPSDIQFSSGKNQACSFYHELLYGFLILLKTSVWKGY